VVSPIQTRPPYEVSPRPAVPPRKALIYFRTQLIPGEPTPWEAVRSDGSGLQVAFSGLPRFLPDQLSFSPDGLLIADNLIGQPGIWVANADGSDLRQLTNGVNDAFPDWAPDGRQIAFAGTIAPSARACSPDRSYYGCPRDLYTMNADGTDIRRVTSGGGVSHPVWSPDGRQIAFTTSSGPSMIAVINADGTAERIIARTKGGSDLNPSWSPDGGTIVYSSIRYEDWGIFAVPARGGAEWALVPAGSSFGYVDDPVFSPDGRTIAFVGGGGLAVMRADGSGVRIVVWEHVKYGPGAIAWQSVSSATQVST
jgi:TolB protein